MLSEDIGLTGLLSKLILESKCSSCPSPPCLAYEVTYAILVSKYAITQRVRYITPTKNGDEQLLLSNFNDMNYRDRPQ